MKQFQSLVMIFSIVLIVSSLPISAQDNINFKSVTFEIKLNNNLVKSNQVLITINDSQTGSITPSLPSGYEYMLSFDSEQSYNFTESENNQFSFISDTNLIKIGRNITLYLSTPTELTKLGTREVNNLIWVHVRHVYSNWTIGDNVPVDGRGFGQGVVADSLILNSLSESTISSEADLLTLAEDIFNILFATSTDLNNDNDVKALSDSYGLFNYSVGMRDHIRNAGNGDPDSTSEIATTANEILSSFDDVIGTLTLSTNLTEFGVSNTMFGKTYNSIMQVVENVTSTNLATYELNLKSNVTELTAFLIENYESFRDLVFNFNIEISDLKVDIAESTSTSTGEPTTTKSEKDDSSIQFSIFMTTIVLLSLLLSKIKSIQKKL
ncbi:MAG: hypothetical protein ACW99A_08300 [Candidatus Kariarchaeaceae archaeon]|jgi:hypothetical protein